MSSSSGRGPRSATSSARSRPMTASRAWTVRCRLSLNSSSSPCISATYNRHHSPIRTPVLANQDASTRQSGREYSPNLDASTRQSRRDYPPIRTRILANQMRGHLYPIFAVLWSRDIKCESRSIFTVPVFIRVGEDQNYGLNWPGQQKQSKDQEFFRVQRGSVRVQRGFSLWTKKQWRKR